MAKEMLRWTLAALVVSVAVSDELGMDSLGKVMRIQEAIQESIIQAPPQAAIATDSASMQLGEVANLQDDTARLADERQNQASREHKKTHRLIVLHELISAANVQSSAGTDLGESDQLSPLQKLLDPTTDQADPIADVVSYLRNVASVSPREMSDLRHFYIEETTKALQSLHGESHNIMRRYAHKELTSLQNENLSFEGLSVGVQDGLDKTKTGFGAMLACLQETSRLCKFLTDIQHIKAHPWHDDWSRSD